MSPLVPRGEMDNIINKELEKYFINKQSVEKTLLNIENRINAVIEKNRNGN